MNSETLAQRSRQAFILGWPFANLGGVNEVVRNLVREFGASGNLAPLVIETSEGFSIGTLPDDIPLLRLRFPTVYRKRQRMRTLLKFCLYAPVFIWKLRSICRRFKIEVLNPHFIGLEYFALLLFRHFSGYRGKLLLSFHGSDIRTMIQSRGLERFLSRLLLRGADTLIPCSAGLGEEILMFVPECANRIVPIANGIDIERFLASSEFDIELPPSFKTRKQILNIGAYEYKKGQDILLKAFSDLRRTRADVCLLIAGQPREELNAIERLIDELELQDHVLLLENLAHSRVAGLLQTSELFVLSSRWKKGAWGEGFAMALLEAAAAQKPVVSTLTCGVTELIRDGESGLIVPPEDPDALAQAMAALLDNPQEAERQAKNLHAKVKQSFTWKNTHYSYLKLSNR